MFAICLLILSMAMLSSGFLGLTLAVPFLITVTGIVIAWQIAFNWIAPWFELPKGPQKLLGLVIFILIFKFVIALIFLLFGLLFAGMVMPVMPFYF